MLFSHFVAVLDICHSLDIFLGLLTCLLCPAVYCNAAMLGEAQAAVVSKKSITNLRSVSFFLSVQTFLLLDQKYERKMAFDIWLFELFDYIETWL